ncbi:hypothetical protein SAMD00019534_074680 [Acytostelium subglobosum LB1]|uniref:hypothetical protein n=1 Tax=Acytostelium subglobosum LB1 TaxID=1410327 RepID=UPI000644952B|nr:hypothetical protein SAMD00019534_074680 [Acytostelium subglobosum LB1]GAM24293.1 hypothetical protein SAMD00019534_074680 [Acytostelium subglobosum LB1]|eukprot:XP_012752619.1 hypothetical protein SAMD00019534_074680 [Acytostelium subglobosum LB1]
MLSNLVNKDGTVSCKISTFNTDTGTVYFKTYNKNKKCTTISIDDKYIWYTYDNVLDVLTHDPDCGNFATTGKAKTFVSDVSQVISDPLAKQGRSLYVYQKTSQVLTQYVYPDNLSVLKNVSWVNIGSACYISQFGVPDKVSVSYPDGFRIFKVPTSQARDYLVKNDGDSFCGPFVQNGLDVYSLPKVGGNSFLKIVPGLEFQVSRPCINSTNGQIVIKGSVDRYNFSWADTNNTNSSRFNLTSGHYTVQITAKEIDISDFKTLDVVPPNDPTFVNIQNTCQGNSMGALNFSLPKDPSINYTYVIADGNFTRNSTIGYFDFLKSKNYTVKINTTDEYGFKCTYTKFENVVEGLPHKPLYEADGGSCFNKSDGSITITNYNPAEYTYQLLPPSPKAIVNGTFIDLVGSNTQFYTLIVSQSNLTLKCPSYTNIIVPQPPKFRFPNYNITAPPLCYGYNSSMEIEYIKGLDYRLTHQTGIVYHAYLLANGYNRYRNLPPGNYSLECVVSSRDGGVCKKATKYIFIDQPSMIQLNTTLVTPECTEDGKEDQLVYAHGGSPINGTSYLFVGQYANATGPALNVSYWIDGVYLINITDQYGCVSQYKNFTVQRPPGCAIATSHPTGTGKTVNPDSTNEGQFGFVTPADDAAIGIGVGLGIGVPMFAAAVAMGVLWWRGRWLGVKVPATPANTIPIYMGGKIHNIDNF